MADGCIFCALPAGSAAGCSPRTLANAAGKRTSRAGARPGRRRSDRTRSFRGCNVVSPSNQYPGATPFPRQGNGGAGSARRSVTGVCGDSGASGTSGISRPALHASQSGVRAGSHVHVAVFNDRLASQIGFNRGVVSVRSSSADCADRLCAPNRFHVHLATRRRTIRPGARGASQPACSPFVHILLPPPRPGKRCG